jgi:type IV pilus assembly protein PilC
MFNPISTQEKLDFIKNLAVMLKSGIPINDALASLEEQARSKKFRSIIVDMRVNIEKGIPLKDAFEGQRRIFGPIFISLVGAGEASGTLEENLLFLADLLERSEALKNEINATLLYPKIVITATLLLGGGLSVFILPRLVPLFKSLRLTLPFATRALLGFSIFVQEQWLWILIGLGVLIAAFITANRMHASRRILDKLYLRLPFFGTMLIEYELALVAQVFSTLLKSGMSLNESLDIVSETATNISYKEALLGCKERVLKGTTLAEALKEYSYYFLPSFITLVAVGEKSGTLETSFVTLSEFYEKEVRNKTKRLPNIIEPSLLIFIGLTVGFVALAIILPIYQITRGIR